MNFYINIDNKIFGYENKYRTNECTVHNACVERQGRSYSALLDVS